MEYIHKFEQINTNIYCKMLKYRYIAILNFVMNLRICDGLIS